jgi:hypothetical protein
MGMSFQGANEELLRRAISNFRKPKEMYYFSNVIRYPTMVSNSLIKAHQLPTLAFTQSGFI